uniref:Plexin-B1 n=1 Tax=Electrophorus electricus TaxID=8005 RepID=A0A4W4HSD3_ELEEL
VCVCVCQRGMALFLFLLLLLLLLLAAGAPYPRFSSNDTVFQHLALHPDPAVGTLYVGARDRLYQLAGLDGLRLEAEEQTGPVRDSKECLPPVTTDSCPQARLASNHNKLLLAEPHSLQLVTCGSAHQGTCQKRSLANVSRVLFSAARPVDTQYVAANDPAVSTVGLVARPRDGAPPLLYVGRGYTSSHPPISTRQLSGEPVFSYEETAKLAVAGRLSEYDHNFVAAFARHGHAYFLFYRRDLKAASREYRSYVARVCLEDQAYYSYVEVPLACHSGSPGKHYNLLQAAQVGGKDSDDGQVLMAVFSTPLNAASSPSEESALCVYGLDEMDRRIDATRDLCYTQHGHNGSARVAYIEYEVKSSCANLPMDTLNAYPCGSDHTPSPMASREPVEAEAVLDSPSSRLTAVAVSVREGHSIAFLGDSKGNLHKVFLGRPGEVKNYSTVPIQAGSPIKRDLLLDASQTHLYIMTKKRPVAECERHRDCQSCLEAQDPYCGWCVAMEVPGLPSLSEGEAYSCFFEEARSTAFISGTMVICSTPPGHRAPPVPPGQGRGFQLHTDNFSHFSSSLFCWRRCTGCVSSRWRCNWCVHQHVCTHKTTCDQGVLVYNQHVSELYACPCVESVEGSSLLPINTERKITLVARNLHLYQVRHECHLRTPPTPHIAPCSPAWTFLSSSVFAGRLCWSPRLCVCVCFTVRLYNCSVGRADCSRCYTAEPLYDCTWCEGSRSRCVHRDSCTAHIQHICPAPHIHLVCPLSGPVEGGTLITISGSNLGQRTEDIQHSVTVAGAPCTVLPSRYEISSRYTIVCETTVSGAERRGQVSVEVKGGGSGQSAQHFHYQDPVLLSMSPLKGPISGGTLLTIVGRGLMTGQGDYDHGEFNSFVYSSPKWEDERIECVTSGSNKTGEHGVSVQFGRTERHLKTALYHYTPDPNITNAFPSKSFLSGGRVIRVYGQNLDVVQEPRIRYSAVAFTLCFPQMEERCMLNTSTLLLCPTPALGPEARHAAVAVHFLLDNLRFDFQRVGGRPFVYEPNPILRPLSRDDPGKPYRHKPGSIIAVEGENLDLAILKEEVVALIGDGVCAVKTLTRNHLYCEPPSQQPSVPVSVRMGNLNFSLGRVQYDSHGQPMFPLEAQVGVGVGASVVALIVLVIVLVYRRKSKQALRDYKKVQIQLENLETSVRDRCKKEFTDLMTEMMDMSSDLVGSGIPFLDYRSYADRIFFPGHRESPLRRDLDVPACRRATVEQGLVQLSNLLNSKLFLTKFIHTLEGQRTFSPRDRAYVASLLTVALHGKLEYFTDILKTLLGHLVEQYTCKNPKLMLRRTESVVEKLLTNWMSICLYSFLRDSAGESLYMLFRAIKHQVDKGPVDAVTGKAKYTLNDNRLLREDVEYRTLTLNALVTSGGASESQTVPIKVLDCDTITQVKEKLLEHTWKGTSYSQRPSTDSVHLEWRAGMAGHLILSDEDLTSVMQGSWKRLNTLQHYKVPDGATVTLVSRQSKQVHHDSHDYVPGEKTPMLEDGEEGVTRLWHLVKASEEPEMSKHRRGSLRERERERAKAIPEIYLTRLLSMKGTLQKFVDDLFTVILSTSRPVPLAVKYFFDLLDDQAAQHNITDPETIHIWKTNSLPLRFWINVLKNPQFIFDVQASDNVDAVLSVIAQTFMDSCTIADHKLGRDSPINKLLYARDIPRYKQMVEKYYADIKQTISASDQEMNSALAELSRNYSSEVNHLVALHELYKYINKYYDQIITALEDDSTAQKMQLGYRLQQIAAAVENKVTDL